MFFKKKSKFKVLSCFLITFIIIMQVNIQNVLALTSAPTLVSAVTDHIGKKIILTFDKSMADPAGTQNQFTVAGTYTQYISSTNKGNFVSGNIPVTSAALGSDSTQILLSMSTAIQPGTISLGYTDNGIVQASDGAQLQSFTAQSVTNNNICSTADIVDFDYDATEIGYDTSDPSNPILKYKFDKQVDYDNVQLAWYFYNGFFSPMVDDLNNYVKFYEKDTGNNVVLPNILTRPNSPATYKDGSTKNQQIVTDWYFWQLQHYAPLGLNLVSQALKPSTTYVIEIDKGFKFNNNATIQKTFTFEFTTTTDSLTKPYWDAGSSVTTSNVTENSLALSWTAAKDNHMVTGYNIYKNGELLTTVDGSTTSYNVSGLSAGTEYKFKVEAVDFANNYSSDCIEATQKTSMAVPAAPNVTADDAENKIVGIDTTMEYSIDGGSWIKYASDPDLSGTHTVTVRVAADSATGAPAGSVTTLNFTANPLTLVSAVTDHIGKKIILTFDRPMADPAGTQNQFTVAGTYTQYISSTNKGNFVSGNIPVTSAALGSDPTQIILSMSTAIQSGDITLGYSKGSVQASDETQLQSFTAQSVTNNNICSAADIVDFDYDATEIAYDTSNPSNPILKYKYDKPVDYDNVQLAWYFYNGFFTSMVDNVNNYVKFYEKDTGNNVVLPNILTRPNSPATYKDGSTKNQQIVTDWYFWQLQHYAPLGLNLVSQALKPSTTYVIEIDKGFKFNNNATIQKTFTFEFTTTADSLTKPYWDAGSSVTTSDVTENSLTLSWTAAKDNHGVTNTYIDSNDSDNRITIPNLKYNIYQNDVLLTTVDGTTTSYNVSNLSAGTEYKFKVEAVDFANNHSSTCLEVTQVLSTAAPSAPEAPSVTANDAANKIVGIDTTMEYSIDGGNWTKYTSDPDLTGTHTVTVRVAADSATGAPAGSVTTLNFTANPAAPEAPNVSADDAANKIVGIDTTMEYSIDGGNWTKYTSDPDLSGTHTVTVRVAADSATGAPAGSVTTLNFTANPAEKEVKDNSTGITVKGDLPAEVVPVVTTTDNSGTNSTSNNTSSTNTASTAVGTTIDGNTSSPANANEGTAASTISTVSTASGSTTANTDGSVETTTTDTNGSKETTTTDTNGSKETTTTAGTSSGTTAGTGTTSTSTDLNEANLKTGSPGKDILPIVIIVIMAITGLVLVEIRRRKRHN